MTTRNVVTDEQLGQYTRRASELLDRVRNGVVSYEKAMASLQTLLETSAVQSDLVSTTVGPWSEYRRIKNLIFIGPEEWDLAMRARDRQNPNPLGLETGWCPQPPVPYSVREITEMARFCQKSQEWKTWMILWLALPDVAGVPTSIDNQLEWWGVQGPSQFPGKLHRDVFYGVFRDDDFTARDPRFREKAAVTKPTWMIGYELPHWTYDYNFEKASELASKLGLEVATATQDALMLNLAIIACRKWFRTRTYSLTSTLAHMKSGCESTIRRGVPLGVGNRCGVAIAQELREGGLLCEDDQRSHGVSVLGVPRELTF